MDVTEHLGLVGFIINKYFKRRMIARNYEFDDLYQIGSIGLMKAADTFDDKRGVKFSTHACKCIYSSISHFFRDDTWILGNRESRLRGESKEPISLDLETGENSVLLDNLGVNDFENCLIDRMYIRELMSNLDAKEFKIIYSLYFLNLTQMEIAERLDTNQPKVHRLMNKALEKMRQSAASRIVS